MFLNSVKLLVRRKQAIFWAAIFPLVLMVLFYFCFGSINAQENCIDARKIAVSIEGDSMYEKNFKELLTTLNDQYKNGESDLDLDVTYCDSDKFKELFDNEEIEAAYKVTDGKIEILLPARYKSATGMIVRQIADTYHVKYSIIEDAISKDPTKIMEIADKVQENVSYIEVDEASSGKDPYFWYFISTVVMGIMFNYMAGIYIVNNLRANASYEGMRIALSPESKFKLIACNFFAALLVNSLISMGHLAIIEFVFGKSVFAKPGLIIVAVVLSNAFSISLGIILAFFFKGNVETKVNKSLGIIMVMEFLSGEFIADIPGTIEKYCPILNRVLPSTVIKMIFYRLTTWDEVGDLYINFAKLAVAVVIMLVVSAMLLRSESYESV